MKKIEVVCPECGHRIVTTDEDFFNGKPIVCEVCRLNIDDELCEESED